MKLLQFKYVLEVVRQNLNISMAAETLYTSQPGISKQIRQLEDELGIKIFERRGKHLAEITPVGKEVVRIAETILEQVENIKNISRDFNDSNSGTLSIATTHTYARYVMPMMVKKFTSNYPKVALRILQGTPYQILDFVENRVADFGIVTEDPDLFSDLIALPCYNWVPKVVVPKNHELRGLANLELADIAKFPLVTYLPGFNGRTKVDEAFRSADLSPNVVLEASDTDVIKTYVKQGFGVGIIASPAFDAEEDQELSSIDVGHLYEKCTTQVVFREGTLLRAYMHDFIESFAPHLSREIVTSVLSKDVSKELKRTLEKIDLPSY